MGLTSSTANYDIQNDVLDSETIRRNIMQVFQSKQVTNNSSDIDTLNWHTYNDISKLKSSLHGGMIYRNRYDQYNPEELINQLMNQINNKNQTGGIPLGFESDSYKEISDNVLGILRKQILQQTSTDGLNNQLGGSCACDSGAPVSSTSPVPIDYTVIRGGGRNGDLDNKNKRNKNKKKKGDGEGDKDIEDMEGDMEEDEEIDIDEDEDFEDEENNEDEDEDEEEEGEEEGEEDDEEMKRLHQRNKRKGDKRYQERQGYEQSGSSQSEPIIDDIIKPFYSSDSDYYNIKERSGRFN